MSKFDLIMNHVKEGGSFEMPLSELNPGKVSKKFNIGDFFREAKRRVFQRNPIAPNQADIVNWILYDRVTVAAAAAVPAVMTLFNQPIGTAAKTKNDTNLDQVSRLADPMWFNATHLGFYFNSNIAHPDLQGFLNSEYMEFWVGQKTYLEGPVQCFPAGVGVQGTVALSTVAAATEYINGWTNGAPNQMNLYDLRLPGGLHLGKDANGSDIITDGLIGITILQGQSFKILLKNDGVAYTALAAAAVAPVLGTGITVSAYIHGILSRGVQ